MIARIVYLLFFSLFIVPFKSSAISIFALNADCKAQNNGVISVKVEKDFPSHQRFDEQKSKELIKKKLYAKLLKRAKEHNAGQIKLVKSTLREDYRSNGSMYWLAQVKFKVVESCQNGLLNEQNFLAGELLADTNTDSIEFKVVHHAKTKKKAIALTTPSLTQNAIFGIPFGTSFNEFEQQVGRFSVYWQVSKHQKITLLGRNHAFIFENNKFVGYQYAPYLLPAQLSNHIEIVEQPANLLLKNGHSVALTDIVEQSKSLSHQFPDIKFRKYKYDNERFDKKIASLAIGNTSVNFKQNSNATCFMGAKSIEAYIAQQIEHLDFYYYDNDGKKNLLTFCSEVIALNKGGLVNKLTLHAPFTTEGYELTAFSMFAKQSKPWQFGPIQYGLAETELSQRTGVSQFIEQYEYDSQDWYGEFYVENNQTIAASLYPN